MIRVVKGEYLFYDKGAVVVLTESGLGLRIYVPDTSKVLNSKEGDEITIYTHLHVKEDAMLLYGFEDVEGLRLFEKLIGVNGVGPKAGLAIMSLGTPNQLKQMIASKDSQGISRASGVGKKTAERVILELSDKVEVIPFTDDQGGEVLIPSAEGTADRLEAVMALTTLGYTKKEAETAVSNVTEEGISAEEYIKKALKFLL